ncbi:MAG: 16S rRNA (adenine(1518)-N(6)/adenine(1519)-N(6))-dimethyltransferase RsmA [bacterium]
MKNFRPIKRLGQHFLKDNRIASDIINIAQVEKNDTVLEIGPGQGVLTSLIAKRARSLIAVEIDKKLCDVLEEKLRPFNNIRLIQADFLKVDLSTLHLAHGSKVIGNLPYYITTPIIMKLLEARQYISSITVMVQKEVAERIVARAGDSAYGVLSIAVSYSADARIEMPVPAEVFSPRPKVASSVLKLEVLKEPRVKIDDEKMFFRAVKGAFTQRRKMLGNSLAHSLHVKKELIREVLEELGIDATRRPQTLTIGEFAGISNSIFRLK